MNYSGMEIESIAENENNGPELCLESFTGPLNLLYSLIESSKISLYDIPIAELTDQYLVYLEKLKKEKLEEISDFILMAATLIQIKSKMLLPESKDEAEGSEDPRDELVMKLLQYRRIKFLAEKLEKRDETNSGINLRKQLPPEFFGILSFQSEECESDFSAEKFFSAAERLSERNGLRFQGAGINFKSILKREKFSLAAKIKDLKKILKKFKTFIFQELFSQSIDKNERLTCFLALLELLRTGRAKAEQKENFAAIEVWENAKTGK